MNIDRAIFCFAGLLVVVGCALTSFVHPLWILLPLFVGLNMMQASFTGFCPAAKILKALGVRQGNAF